MPAEHAIPFFSWVDSTVTPQAVLICIHGLGLHAGTYRTLGERIARLGIATYAIDVRGFGAWTASQQCKLDFDGCAQDLQAKIAELRARHLGLPIFLLGESLGGAIATRFAADNSGLIDGLITSAPVRRLSSHKLEVLRSLWQFICHPLRPINLSSHIIDRAPYLVAVNDDRAFRMHFSASELIHLCQFMETSFRKTVDLSGIPVLVLQGHGDDVVDSKSTLAFFDRLKTKDKSLIVLGDSEHLIFQTLEIHPKALQFVQEWISERIPAAGKELRQVS